MVDVYANLEIFLAISVLGFALIQAVVSLVSYQRLRNQRAFLIGVGFLAFAAKGAYLVVNSWTTRGESDWILPVAALDLLILLLLYFAVRSR